MSIKKQLLENIKNYKFNSVFIRSLLVIFCIMAVATSIMTFCAYMLNSLDTGLIFLVLILFSLLLSLVLSAYISIKIFTPVESIMEVLESEKPSVKTTKKKKENETDYILRRIVNMRRSNAELIDVQINEKNELKNAQTMMLQMQINPHFLGNTLNVINWMAIEMTMCENSVSNAIGKLARLFKSYSDATDYMTDFDSEIEFTNQYVDILKLRYPDTFSIEWNVDERYLNARVPRIILQPLVENAVYHGIKPLDEKGCVKVSSYVENNLFTIAVEDSGKGMSDESIQKINSELTKENAVFDGHVGLKNVNRRLKLIYGNDYGVNIEKSASGGLRVIIQIPYVYMSAKLNYKTKNIMPADNVFAARETIELLTKKMMSMRKRADVEYIPYVKPVGYDTCWPSFDFEKIYPDWKEGDVGFVTANLIGPCDRDMVISVTGDCEIFFNGEIPESFESDLIPESFKVHGIHSYRVKFFEGENHIIIRQRAASDYFKFEIYVGDESGPISWPVEYNYRLRSVIPFGSMKDIEGFAFSRIYKKDESLPDISTDAIEWIGPEAPPDVENIAFDFSLMTTYSVACGVTRASGEVKITHASPVRVYLDGENVYSESDGCFECKLSEEKLLCVEADKAESGFGFKAESGNFRVPGYKSDRKDLSWIWLEGVENAASRIQFTKPYVCTDGKKTFFRYLRKDTYYRPYLNTCFFGQWFYAIMLGHYAILKMAEELDKQEFIDYFVDSIDLICEYYEYVQYDKETFGVVTMLYSSTRLESLVAIGPTGMSVFEYIKLTDRDNGKRLLKVLENALRFAPRSQEGIFWRINSYTTDDFFMAIPFLARLGGDYLTDALKQLKGLYTYLYMKDKKLFSHIYFTEKGKANQIPWCRGNGWAMLSLSELLMHLPEEHPERGTVLEIFREFADGILNYQGKKGMWHQIIDEHETFEESSGTGMLITAMARGVKNGWLSRDIVPNLWKAWNRLSEICIDDDGNVLGICIGAGTHMEREYYRKMGACMNDDHGVGIILLAGTEMLGL